MDKMIYHTGHYPRQLNLIPHVSDVGFLINKTDVVQQTFNSCNFSFVVRGNGWFWFKGRKIKVLAPAILLQWPNESMLYGPDNKWDEYFFKYKAEDLATLNKACVFDINNPVIELRGYHQIMDNLQQIIQLTYSTPTVFPADKLDMLCWGVVSETYMSFKDSAIQTDIEKKIIAVADNIKSKPLKDYDLKLISKELGMAIPTFRRYWLKYIGVSPGRYISDIKLTIACKELIETSGSIGDISRYIGMDDPLYFSRFFKKKTGLTPTEYRKNHKLN